jgi:hypothetical protein
MTEQHAEVESTRTELDNERHDCRRTQEDNRRVRTFCRLTSPECKRASVETMPALSDTPAPFGHPQLRHARAGRLRCRTRSMY